MSLGRIGIWNFRNIAEAPAVSLAPGLTLVSGQNAQGKTNFLEAVGLLLAGLALRGQSDRDMIREGEEGYRIVGDWTEPGGAAAPLVCSAARTPLRRRRDGAVHPVVMFSPDDVLLVKGGPDGRRRLLDLTLSQLYPYYGRQLRAYQRALAQRNRALKEGATDAVLDSFAPALAEAGAYLWERRTRLVDALTEEMAPLVALLAPQDTPTLVHLPGGHAAQRDARGILEALARRRLEERARGMTLTGPHRDDLDLSLNGRSARLYASQGQQRTLALGLKLAARGVLERQLGERPVVLLDDVLSELDGARRHALLDVVARGGQQTIVTDTQGDRYQDLTPWHLVVEAGRIAPADGGR